MSREIGPAQQAIVLPPLVGRVHPWVRSLMAYLIGVAVLVGVTLVEHKPAEPVNTAEEGRLGFWSTDFWYARVVGTPDPRDSHVAVITVGKDMQKDFPLKSTETNTTSAQRGKKAAENRAKVSPKNTKVETPPEACRRRLYISELLKVLANLYPKVVVLDIWLDPELCSDKAITGTLFDELEQFSKRAPIILGVPSRNATDLKADSPAEFAYMSNREPTLLPTELVLMPVTKLPPSTNGRIIEAVVRRDSDARRIPLSWPVYDGFPEVSSSVQPKRKDTLSVAAVRAFDPHHTVLKIIDALNPDGSSKVSTQPYPFTSFLREDQIPIKRAIDVICASSPNESWTAACARNRVFSLTPDMFKDKVVVIGIAGLGGDLHQTILGKVPGVILQANYIESLLSSRNRIYKPLPLLADLLVGAVWLIAVFSIAWCFRFHPVVALTLSLLATILPAYLILKFLIWLGYYTELLIPLAIAALVTNVTVQFHHFLIHQGGTP